LSNLITITTTNKAIRIRINDIAFTSNYSIVIRTTTNDIIISVRTTTNKIIRPTIDDI
jgi:hypothetical protein